MNEPTEPQAEHKPYEWAEELFSNKYDIDPKYRDMLAMLASTMMGNPGAAKHFYNQALVDGASDQELARVAQIVHAATAEIAKQMVRAQPEPAPGHDNSSVTSSTDQADAETD